MKKLMLIICCLSVLIISFNTVEAGPIKLKVFGKGGIIQKPDGTVYVCPHTSSEICTEVTIEQLTDTGGSFQGINGVMNYSGQQYLVEIVKVEILYYERNHYVGKGLVVKGNIQQ